jgi:type IV pilus assembly protein PilA
MTFTLLRRGFTMIELVIVIAVIAILALMALPVFIDKGIREHVNEGMKLTEHAKDAVALAYKNSGGVLPADNAAAALPPPDKIMNAMVSSLTVADGAITIKFGNNAHSNLAGKQLTMRPVLLPVVPGFNPTPITSWLCNDKPLPPDKPGLQVQGKNLTDIPYANLPVECRGGQPK